MKENKINQGSYTVEAAFLIPFLLLIIFSLCYLSFYLYDQIVIETVMHRELMKKELETKFELDNQKSIQYQGLSKRKLYSFLDLESNEGKEEFVQKINMELKKRLIIFESLHPDAKCSWEELQVKVSGSNRVSMPFANQLLGNKILVFEAAKDIHNPCDSIRRWEMLIN